MVPFGQAKMVRACIALRNRNGGHLLVGFDDRTLQPDKGKPPDPKATFRLDDIQGLVSKYASTPFEVGIAFGERDGVSYPVVVVPSGVTVPVAAKADLVDGSKKKKLVSEGTVYFRTLRANGTVSTAAARPQDWAEIVEICFENREADIGRFLRRHLTGTDLGQALARAGLLTLVPTSPTLRDRATKVLDDGHLRFEEALAARHLSEWEKKATKLGTWSVGLAVEPAGESDLPTREFLNAVVTSNPHYTGWPVWLDTRGFHEESARPRVIAGGWQVLSFDVGETLGFTSHLDFYRLEPEGNFFLLRIHQDDLSPKVKPMSVLDPVITLLRVAEAIAVGLTFTKVLGWDTSSTKLGFAFKWTRLKGRELSPWGSPRVVFSGGRVAADDEATTFAEVPADTPVDAIAPLVQEATRGLFVLFDGFQMPLKSVESWVRRLVERKF